MGVTSITGLTARKLLDGVKGKSNPMIQWIVLAVGLLSVSLARAQPLPSSDAAKIYAKRCASCYGADLQGRQGPALLPGKYLHGTDDETVARSIKEGYPEKGMPGSAWGIAVLPDGRVLATEEARLLARHQQGSLDAGSGY